MFRQIQIDADDVYQLFCELGMVPDLEVLHPGRFQAVTAPDTTHASLADAYLLTINTPKERRLSAKTPK